MRVTVLSTFDIWPPRDGGQSRYVELWRRISAHHDVHLLAYDFRNVASERRYKLEPRFTVTVPAASQADADLFHRYSGLTRLWLHDVLCLREYAFSDSFRRHLADLVRDSDVVVASHPYLASLAFAVAPAHALKVYESFNVEYDVKKKFFASGADQTLLRKLLATIYVDEGYAARSAHHVTAVSAEERLRLTQLYGLSAEKTSVVPNGARVRSRDLMTEDERQDLRSRWKLPDAPVGVFLGSSYPANVLSYRRVRSMLEAAEFRGVVLLVGGIIDAPRGGWAEVGFEERWLGFVEEPVKALALEVADFALHLIFDGAGTNLKLFDYMGAAAPVIGNDLGLRGVDDRDWCWTAESTESLMSAIAAIRADRTAAKARAMRGRELALQNFDWDEIAAKFERGLSAGFPIAEAGLAAHVT